jgi:hypothetical protein
MRPRLDSPPRRHPGEPHERGPRLGTTKVVRPGVEAAAGMMAHVGRFPPSEPMRPAPAGSSGEATERREARGMDLALNLPALARRNPYLVYHRGWVYGYWNARIADSRPVLTPGDR